MSAEDRVDQITAWADGFINGKVLLFNKPLYWTSFDLVNKIKSILRNALNLKKLRVGHAGTLDPLASGLMILCTGKETRNIEKYQSLPKEYIARITLGAVTPSFDLETDISRTFPVEHINRSIIEETIKSFKGNQMQMPPDFSARFVGGTRAYKLARKGEKVDLKPREILINEIDLISIAMPLVEIRVNCSKGTYIRSLARDIGERMNSGAYLSGLVRTAIGDFSLNSALSIEEFERNFIFL
ncbi:MAG TPA: tRNA pseudouridine(55) synthase TruB [Bacteroidales bacterium]|jgi:tRNA pseudouridine55 synthase|nr:tRNA pseudouridine(55) synthase TruB [Bacteroidales bacterium]